MIKKTICQFLQGLKEAVEVHLIIITPPDNIFVYYIIVSLQDVTIS